MSLIVDTANDLLAQALASQLQRHGDTGAALGDLGPTALRLGLLQNSLKPQISAPQLLLVAADHGLAVEGLPGGWPGDTPTQVAQVLAGQAPVAVFARQTGLALTVVDGGVASPLAAHERLLQRKIAHGSRNARMGPAMTVDQAQAAIRAGMEIGDTLPGNLVACAGLGAGSDEAAALVLSRLTKVPVRELIAPGPAVGADHVAQLVAMANHALARHREVTDPVEVMAALGGFDAAVLVGVMLVAASKRHVILVDGLAACAALQVAACIAPPVLEYAVFCRSRQHLGLGRALALFNAVPLLPLALDALDGTAATLTWPLLGCAAALLAEAGDTPPAAQPQRHDGSAGHQATEPAAFHLSR